MLADPQKRTKLENIALLLKAAIEAHGRVGIMLNIRRADLETILALLPALQGGDVGRGQAVFNSEKAACYGCHAIGYMGGRIGPDLTRIGQVRSERDLLEAVVFPNASFARGYEPVVIRTCAGLTARPWRANSAATHSRSGMKPSLAAYCSASSTVTP